MLCCSYFPYLLRYVQAPYGVYGEADESLLPFQTQPAANAV
jgi:hypothetical protein